MKLVYCDEAGDPGKLPKSESEIFILAFLYLKSEDWKSIFHQIIDFRRELKTQFNFPTRLEFHTREFVLNKNPYTVLSLSNQDRIQMCSKFALFLKKLSNNNELKCINCAVVKKRIDLTNKTYNIFYQALSLGLTRIDTNIFKNKQNNSNFMLIVDDGYLKLIRKISRRLYRHNYVPYLGNQNGRQIKLESLIDDPLPKNSKDSYFIQIADFIAYVVSQFIYIKLNINHSPKRKRMVADDLILEWMKNMKGIFNTQASPRSEFGHGIVVHPENKKDGD